MEQMLGLLSGLTVREALFPGPAHEGVPGCGYTALLLVSVQVCTYACMLSVCLQHPHHQEVGWQ